jgi:hypothetical protein
MGKSLVIKGADFSEIAIPKEYTVLDWIASGNGASFFNTGFKPTTASNRFEIDFSLSTAFLSAQTGVAAPYVVLFGDGAHGYNTNTGLLITIRKYPSSEPNNNTVGFKEGTNYFGSPNNENTVSAAKITDSEVHTLSISQTNVLLDGVLPFSSQPSGGTLETAINNGIAICGTSGIASGRLVGLESTNIQSYKISNGVRTSAFRIFANEADTNPIHNFVPVLRTEDGKPYFYDTVNAVYVPASNNGAGVIYALNGTMYNYDGSEYSE